MRKFGKSINRDLIITEAFIELPLLFFTFNDDDFMDN